MDISKFPVLEVRLTFRGERHLIPGSLEANDSITLPLGATSIEVMRAALEVVDGLRDRVGVQ